MAEVLLLVWLLGVLYVFVSLIYPLPPFKTRIRTLGFGTIGLTVSFFLVAVIGGISGLYTQEETKTTIAKTPKPIKRLQNTTVKTPEPSGYASQQISKRSDWQKAGFPDKKSYDAARAKTKQIRKQDLARQQKLQLKMPVKTMAKSGYDPQSASEATGFTMRRLDEHQLKLLEYAAQFVTMTDWCNYSYFLGNNNPVKKDYTRFGVHPFDFKNFVRERRTDTLRKLNSESNWRKVCGKTIYRQFGKNGILFGTNGEFPNSGPWIKRITLKPGMTKKQVNAEVELGFAYYGGGRCITGFSDLDAKKVDAYRAKSKLTEEWNILISDQSVAFNNETFFRLGPESLMDCAKFVRKYRKLLPDN